MNEELKVKFEKALADEVYAKELFALDTPEKVQAKLAEKDIVLTLDEVKALVIAVVDAAEKTDSELDENALEGIAGGFGILAGIGVIAMGAAGAAIGWRLAKGKCSPL